MCVAPQWPLQPIPASPTSPPSVLGGSSSSGVSSLSDGSFSPAPSEPPASCSHALDSLPSSQAWTPDQEDPDWDQDLDPSQEPAYQPVSCSPSEPEVLEGGVAVGGEGLHLLLLHQHHQHLLLQPPCLPPLYHLHQPPPALPPKPFPLPEEEPAPPTHWAPPPPAPRPTGRRISLPLVATREEQAGSRVAWERSGAPQ